MAGVIGQTTGDEATARLNARLTEDEANLKQTFDNHEAVVVSGLIPAEFNTANFFSIQPKGDLDASNTKFTLPGLPDNSTLVGTLVTSGVTQSLIEDLHYTRQGTVITFGTAPPDASLGADLRFSFAETTKGSTLKIPHRLNKKPRKCFLMDKEQFGDIRVVKVTDRDIEVTAEKETQARFLLE